MQPLLYGVAYYDEHMAYDRLDDDIRMMQAAGINSYGVQPDVDHAAAADFARLSPQLINLKKTNRTAMLATDESLTALEWFKLPGSNHNYNDVVRLVYLGDVPSEELLERAKCWSRSGWASGWITNPRNYRADSSSAWRSPAR